MTLEKVARMGLSELAGRSRQEARRRLERLGAAAGPRALRDRPGRIAAVMTPATAFLLRDAAARFFEGVTSPETPRLLEAWCPATRARILAEAESLLGGRFDLLGYRDLDFGAPTDWHLDPVSGRRAPFRHWSLIDPLSAEVGDAKVIWELNRHQWLVTLAQAYRLTGDERFAEQFVETVRLWRAANPPGWGINWTSSLEGALRLISWCWALHLVRGSPALAGDRAVPVIEGIEAHAARIERYLSRYTSPNTHLTGEALGLFYAGSLFPWLTRAERWRSVGESILLREIERQVLPDGVYFERSTCYQQYTIEIYLHYVLLAQRAGRVVPDPVLARLRRMLGFLLALLRRNGAVPSLGDADGGCLLPLERRDPGDVRGVFSTAAALFGRPDYAWAVGGLAPETLWLLGPGGARAFRALRPAPPSVPASRLFEDGGYAVMRGGWTGPDHCLVLDVGSLGVRGAAGHAHAGLLAIDCAVSGEACVVDPGTFRYAVDPAWRDHFRGTSAHSTVTIDGIGQAQPSGPFGWRTLPRARIRRWVTTEAYDLADSEHEAYLRLRDPVVHRRRVVFVKPRYWVVLDDLRGAAGHRVEARLQFAPQRVEERPDGWVRASLPGGAGLFVRAFAEREISVRIAAGDETPRQGWVAPGYGVRLPAPLLILTAEGRLPLRILTLLLPARSIADEPPRAVAVSADDGTLSGLEIGEGGETLLFLEEGIVMTGTPVKRAGTACAGLPES